MIPLIKSTFYNENETQKRLSEFVKKAKQLSFGPECQKFESEFAAWQERKHCIMVNSGSSANLAIIQALINLKKLSSKDAVGFSAVTWSTNVMPLIQLGLTPVPIDVELQTLNISSKTLLNVLSHTKLKALFVTNLLGFCDDLDEVAAICKKKNIILIEDNCESLGSVYKGKKLGNFGIASTFSFYVGHHMSTVEGGAVCTDSSSLSTMLHLVRAHGWDRNLTYKNQIKMRKKFHVNSTFYSRYTFYDLGYNLRPTEITGFLGHEQLQYLSQIIRRREQNFKKFSRLYTSTDKYFPIKYDHLDVISNFAVPLVCKSEAIRDELVKKCENVLEIRPIVGGDMTAQPFMMKYLSKGKYNYPNAYLIHKQGLYFGNNPDMTKKDIETILSLFGGK